MQSGNQNKSKKSFCCFEDKIKPIVPKLKSIYPSAIPILPSNEKTSFAEQENYQEHCQQVLMVHPDQAEHLTLH